MTCPKPWLNGWRRNEIRSLPRWKKQGPGKSLSLKLKLTTRAGTRVGAITGSRDLLYLITQQGVSVLPRPPFLYPRGIYNIVMIIQKERILKITNSHNISGAFRQLYASSELRGELGKQVGIAIPDDFLLHGSQNICEKLKPAVSDGGSSENRKS